MKNLLFVCFTLSLYQGFSQSKHLERARSYFMIEDFYHAKKYYEKVLYEVRVLKDIHQLGITYAKLNELGKSYKWLKKAADYSDREEIIVDYYNVLKQLGRYDELTDHFAKLNAELYSPAIHQLHASCDSVRKWKQHSQTTKIYKLNGINTSFSEISPVFFYDDIVFSSNREGIRIKKKNTIDHRPYFNLYRGRRKDQVYEVSSFASELNTDEHEGGCFFSSSLDTIYFTRSYSNEDGGIGHLKLFSAVQEGNNWRQAKRFIFNDSTVSFSNPFMSKDGKMFFFSSDMQGGYGGTDIYVCFKVDDKWSDPVNLGENINTIGNESYPYLSPNDDLYFASNYHSGFGGYDLFRGVEENGQFVKVENLGHPINSSKNDMSINFNENGTKALISSNRGKDKQDLDIYLIEFNKRLFE